MFDALLLAAAPPAVEQVAPNPHVAKWGAYATLVEVGWWQAYDGLVRRYSWVIPGERLRLDSFKSDGTLDSHAVYRIESDVLVNETAGTRQPITARSASRIAFGTSDLIEVTEGLHGFEWTTVQGGQEKSFYFSRVPQPAFPDAAALARARGTPACPANISALEARWRSATVLQATEEVFMGISNVDRSLAPGEFRFLETTPVSVEVTSSGGQAHILAAMLPGYDIRRYEARFRAAHPRGLVRCDEDRCQWRPQANDRTLPVGALREASLGRVIDSDANVRFLCTYKTYDY